MTVERPRWTRETRAAANLIKKTLAASRAGAVAVELHAITDPHMRKLNRRYRGKDEPTTVLSFPAPADFPGRPGVRHLGEIYLAPATAVRRGQSLRFLAIHGLFHLLGYTHRGKRDTIEMEAAERRALR